MFVFVLFVLQRILAAADFLQNVVSINVQLMEEEKACFAILFIYAIVNYSTEFTKRSQCTLKHYIFGNFWSKKEMKT